MELQWHADPLSGQREVLGVWAEPCVRLAAEWVRDLSRRHRSKAGCCGQRAWFHVKHRKVWPAVVWTIYTCWKHHESRKWLFKALRKTIFHFHDDSDECNNVTISDECSVFLPLSHCNGPSQESQDFPNRQNMVYHVDALPNKSAYPDVQQLGHIDLIMTASRRSRFGEDMSCKRHLAI